MGLDLALGAIILLAAIRGWLKGFILQAIRLSGVVACVYLADPIRDLAKPFVLPHLPSVRPDLVDRLLWWSAAALAYVVLVGIATSTYKLSRRQTIGLTEPNRNDQLSGFALGALKGLIVAMFLMDGLQKYALERVRGIAWAEQQARTSHGMKWNATYAPVAKIWASPPVKHFVEHVQRGGLRSPEPSAARPEPRSLQAASGQPPRLLIPSPSWGLGPDNADLDPELAEAVEAIKNALGRHAAEARPAPAN
jgi:uncharacterized membrane protein required for colicin V production